jgi:uncharacterized membrane protein
LAEGEKLTMRIGIAVYGAASAAAGVLDLIWGEFEPAHQPLQAWGDHIPGMRILAYIAAVWLIAGGAAMLWPRTLRFGAGALAILYGIFVFFPLPRFYTAPHFLGYGAATYIGALGSVCEQVILFVAAAVVWQSQTARGLQSRRAATIARWTFGLCPVVFGLSHLTAVWAVLPLIPKWMPLSGTFWAVLTGIAFVLAGVAIVSGVLDALAAWLLGLMLLLFSALALTPLIFTAPRDHVSWGGDVYNLTAVGAAWIMAQWLGDPRWRAQDRQDAGPARPLPV